MSGKSRNLIGALIVVAVIVGVGVLLTRSQQSTSGNLGSIEQPTSKDQIREVSVNGEFVRGEIVPEAAFSDFEGNSYNLSDFEGKAVVLDFWAGWCPFCINEMPELQSAQDEFGDELVMIGVHRTDTEDPDVGLKFAEERGVTYLLVSDDGTLYRAAGGFGMPVAVFIDKEGVVTEIKSGPKTKEEIKGKIEALI